MSDSRPVPQWEAITASDSESQDAADFALKTINGYMTVTRVEKVWNQPLAEYQGKLYALNFKGKRQGEAEISYQAYVWRKSSGEKVLLSIKSY